MMSKTKQLLEQAKGHLNRKDFDNSLRLFNQVLNREPANREALRYKATIILKTEDKEKAIKFLHSAVERCTDDELYQMLGTLYLKQEQSTEGLPYLLRSIEINKDNTEAHHSLGILYAYHHEDHKNAVKHFTKAINITSDNADAYFNRGCSHMILHNMKEAKQDLLKAKNKGHGKAEEMLTKYFSSTI